MADVSVFLSSEHASGLRNSFETTNDLKWFTRIPDEGCSSARNVRMVSVKQQVAKWMRPHVDATVV